MQPVELPPAHRHHLGRGVQLHGAGAERDHRRGEREVPRLEPLDVAQHLGLGVVPVEDRVLQVRALALQRRRDRALRLHADVVEHEGQRLVQREDRDQVGEVAEGDRLVERDAEPGGRERPQVDLARPGGIQQAGQGPLGHLDAQGVEEGLVHDAIAQPPERVGQQHRPGVHPLGDAAEAAGAVVHGVHARHHREQHLRGADVAGRLVAPDVLLPGLQRHPQRGLPVRVAGDADDAARHEPLVRLPGREEGGVRPAVAHRNAEALAVADRDVGAPLARRNQHRQREEVGGGGDQGAGGVGPLARASGSHGPRRRWRGTGPAPR